MLTWLVMIFVLIALIIVFTWAFAALFGRGEETDPMPDTEVVIEHNRSALEKGQVDDIMFDTVMRGYRQDQVDAVIDQLLSRIGELEKNAGPGGHADVEKPSTQAQKDETRA